ncbi:phosphatase PAP2 family protein [Micromonospora sp. NPDC049559]|uniref:phosphatase PAP2 family protein n=1 Tax=Micromonospora sp. NPDC049559 TaxID=3155923 RepID=UPI00343B77C9
MRETTQTVRRRLRPRPVRPAGWWFDLLLLAALAGITLALAKGQLLGLDLAVREWSETHRPEYADWLARTLNLLGQGGWLLTPLSVLLAVAVAVRVRSVRPLLVVVAAEVLTYLTIGPFKLWTDRDAPSSALPPEQAVKIFNDQPLEYDMSYPSGHLANGIVWYGVIALLLVALLRTLGRPAPSPALARAIRIVPPAILFCTTIYTNFHWLTDSIAGVLLGLFLDRLLARVPWDEIPLPALPNGLDRPGALAPPPPSSAIKELWPSQKPRTGA